jgi:hypothetical protein
MHTRESGIGNRESGSAIRLSVALAALLVVVPWHEASSQLGCSGATCTIEISMPVVDVFRVSLSTGSVSLGAPSDVDYQAGFRDVAGAAVSVIARSNRPFLVDMSALAGSFTYVGALTDPGKPASDLRWATSAAALASTTNHFGSPATLINQGPGNVTLPIYLRTMWDFTRDVPGNYSLAIRLTLSAP